MKTHYITIENLGPISNCRIDLDTFMVLTGPQSSGKSTIAKAIFFFRTIKDDILDLITKPIDFSAEKRANASWEYRLTQRLKDKFMQLFGSTWGMPNNMRVFYHYSDKTSIEAFLVPGDPNYLSFTYSDNIRLYLEDLENKVLIDITDKQRDNEKDALTKLFCDQYETIFIPAGRNLITLLTSQLNYIFTSMDETQRRTIDYCTQRYIERILKMKPSFERGLDGLLSDKLQIETGKIDKALINLMLPLVESILKGKYTCIGGEERLNIEHGRYVKINFASSGQQETVWILNLLCYLVLEHKPFFVIVEEPESHLYPDAQQEIAQLLGLFINGTNAALVTTHSPYVLGEFNNLLLADKLAQQGSHCDAKVKAILHKRKWLPISKSSAYYILHGGAESAIDEELHLIKSELIDGASQNINNECDKLLEIDMSSEEEP